MKFSKKNLNTMLIWGGGAILVIIIIIYYYNKKLFRETFGKAPDQQKKNSDCISKNLKKPISDIAKLCKIPDDFSCNIYYNLNDKNNNFQSIVINGKCTSPSVTLKIPNMKKSVNTLECINSEKKYVKLYNSDGKILTYNKNNMNKGFVEYNENIFTNYKGVVLMEIKCK
jgi:hypothetical protein